MFIPFNQSIEIKVKQTASGFQGVVISKSSKKTTGSIVPAETKTSVNNTDARLTHSIFQLVRPKFDSLCLLFRLYVGRKGAMCRKSADL
jgi:hypothetical protein